MLKILGSVIILGACSGIGFEKSHELQLHLRQLEELKRIFTLLRSELQYHKPVFAELFERVGRKTEGIWNTWMVTLAQELRMRQEGTFQEIWEQSIERCLKDTALKKEDREELLRLGTCLGCTESIDLYLAQLECRIQKTREENCTQKKLYQSMGVLGGIFLVIMLF